MGLFFQLLLLVLGTLLACYGAGTVLCRGLKVAPREPWFTLFVRLVLGLGLLVVLYAAGRTGGQTVLLPLLLLLPAAAWQLRRTAAPADVPALPRLGPLLVAAGLLAVVVFAVRWLLLHDPASPFLRTPFQDYVYYGRLSYQLSASGIETSVLPGLSPQVRVPTPYHYLELWLNAALVRVSGLPATWTLFLGTYSVLVTMVVVGFRAVLAHMGLRGWPAGVLALLLVLVTGVNWPLFAQYSLTRNGALVASALLPVQPKTAPLYLLITLGGLLLLRARFGAAALVLAGLPLLFISTAPASLAGLVGLAFYLGITQRRSWRTAGGMVALAVAVAGYLGAFYGLHAPPASVRGAAHLVAPWLPAPGELPTLVNIAAGTLLNFLLFYAPYGVLLLLLLVAGRRVAAQTAWTGGGALLSWGLTALLTATAARSLATHMLDSVQLFSNLMMPVAAFGVVLGVGWGISRRPAWWGGVVALALLGLAGVNGHQLFSLQTPLHEPTRYSPAFLRQVRAALPGLGNRGGFILADADYETAYTLNPSTYIAGTYVSNFRNDYVLTSLSTPHPDQAGADPRFAYNAAYARAITSATELYQWVQVHGLAQQPGRWDSARYFFVADARLRFVCVSRRATLPLALQSLVQAVYVDAWSGEKFYVLRSWSQMSEIGYENQVPAH